MLKALALAALVAAAPPPDTRLKTAIDNGLRYLQGIGVERDHPRALAWFYVARSIDPSTNYVGMLEPYMTPAQRARAHRIAEDCLTRSFDYCERVSER